MVFCDSGNVRILRKNGNFYTTDFQKLPQNIGFVNHVEYTSNSQYLLTIHSNGIGVVNQRKNDGKFEEKLRITI